jgi:hypothetical protein
VTPTSKGPLNKLSSSAANEGGDALQPTAFPRDLPWPTPEPLDPAKPDTFTIYSIPRAMFQREVLAINFHKRACIFATSIYASMSRKLFPSDRHQPHADKTTKARNRVSCPAFNWSS